MNCPHCQQDNQPLRSDDQRVYYRCARCHQVYWGLLELASPPAVAPSTAQPCQAQAKGNARHKPKPDYRPIPFCQMSPERQRAIRALLRRVKEED